MRASTTSSDPDQDDGSGIVARATNPGVIADGSAGTLPDPNSVYPMALRDKRAPALSSALEPLMNLRGSVLLPRVTAFLLGQTETVATRPRIDEGTQGNAIKARGSKRVAAPFCVQRV